MTAGNGDLGMEDHDAARIHGSDSQRRRSVWSASECRVRSPQANSLCERLIHVSAAVSPRHGYGVDLTAASTEGLRLFAGAIWIRTPSAVSEHPFRSCDSSKLHPVSKVTTCLECERGFAL